MKPDRRQVDFGSFHVHKKVFSQIIADAMESIEGASLADAGWGGRFAALFDRENVPGVSVDLDEQENASITVRILVRPGYNIADLSRVVQSEVRTAIERMINVNLKDINVVVVGLERRHHEIS